MAQTIKITDAEDRGTGYVVTIDLDAGNAADPATDPRRMLELSYSTFESWHDARVKQDKDAPGTVPAADLALTKNQYVQRVKAEIQATARHEQAIRYATAPAPTKINTFIGSDIT